MTPCFPATAPHPLRLSAPPARTGPQATALGQGAR
jgi:hypothetical protein